jgi:uncharacterized protein (DUF608 family)
MMGTLYLAALRAGEEMAHTLGDNAAADEYRRIFDLGRRNMDTELWNGEFYVQKVRNPLPGESIRNNYDQKVWDSTRPDEDQPRYQYGAGCLADQMLGQWIAHVVGLGYLLPEEHLFDKEQKSS